MKKYGSIIHILSLAGACLISAGCATQPGAATARRRIQVACLCTASRILGRIWPLLCLLMARTWEALPKAETTVAIYRQASTASLCASIPIAAVRVRGGRP